MEKTKIWDARKTRLCIDIVRTIRKFSTCCKLKVGALLITEEFNIVSFGYNGTPKGTFNCHDVKTIEQHYSWDEIHAEVNCMGKASNQEHATVLLVTNKPCIACTQSIIANKDRLKISEVWYLEEFEDTRYENNQEILFKSVDIKFRKIGDKNGRD